MSWYLCKACHKDIPTYEKTFHEIFCLNISPNEPAKQLSQSFATPAEETTQVNTQSQNVSHSSTSFTLPNIFPPVKNTIHSAYMRGQISPNFATPADETIQVNTERQNVSHSPASTSFMLPTIFPPVKNTIQSAYERGQISLNFATPADETIQVNTDERRNMSHSSASLMISNIVPETIQSAYDRGQISSNFATPAEETRQVNTDERRNMSHSSTSLMLPDVLPPVKETIRSAYETGQRQPSTASTTQPLLPYFSPYSSPEVQVTMKNVTIYQEVYEKATERSLGAVRKTMESLYTVHRAVNIAAAVSSEKRCLVKKVRQLYLLFTDDKPEPYLENIYSELSKTLVEIRIITAKEKDALCFFERALVQQKVAFDTMLRAANSKHEAFKIALAQFYKKEETIDSEYFKGKSIFPMNNRINKRF